MNKKIISAVGAIALIGGVLGNTAMAEKISSPITGWQASFWNKPEGEAINDGDGGVEITVEPEWVLDGKASLHVWTGSSIPNFNAQAVQNISFEQDADYRFTGSMYISSSSWGFGLYIGADRLTMLRNLVTAGEWTEFDYTFTYQSTYSDFKLQTAQAGDLYADNLSLKKVLYNQEGEVTGYGEELLKNGDFESDYIPADDVRELTAEAKDGGAILRWKNPASESLGSIVIFMDDEELQEVDASQESAELSGLENGREYTLTVKTKTATGVLSEGCEVSVTPFKTAAIPRIIKDDKDNRIIGITEDMEYSLDEGQTWLLYNPSEQPDLSGRTTAMVRYRVQEQGVFAPVQTLYFTPNGSEQQIQLSKAKFEGNNFVADGRLNRAEEAAVTMYIIRHGADRRDFSSVLAIGQTMSDADGSFSFNKPVSEQRNGKETDGFYDVYIDSTITEEIKRENLAFASSDNLSNAASALFTQSDTAALLEKESEHYNTYLAMGLPLEEYHKHPERKADIISGFKRLLSEIDQSDENLTYNICSAFVKAYVMNELRYDDSEAAYDTLREYAEFLKLSYDETTLENVIKESTQQTTFLVEYMAGKSYANYDALNQGFAEGIALYEINAATYGILPSVLEKYSGTLGLNSSSYAEYARLTDNSSEKINASKKIVDIKSRNPFLNSQSVLNAISSAMSSSQNTINPGGSGGGGSTNRGAVSPGLGIGDIFVPSDTAITAPKQKLFPDIQGMEWAEKSIEYLYNKGYIAGYEDGSFRPDRVITREELVTILVNAFCLADENAECSFEDVKAQDWYYRSIASAVKAGLVEGIDDKSFGTGKNISREDLATLAYRSLSRLNFNFKEADNSVAFTDEAQISDYAKEPVNKLSEAGVVNGYQDGSFLPKNTATRAEACVILHRILIMKEAG